MAGNPHSGHGLGMGTPYFPMISFDFCLEDDILYAFRSKRNGPPNSPFMESSTVRASVSSNAGMTASQSASIFFAFSGSRTTSTVAELSARERAGASSLLSKTTVS